MNMRVSHRHIHRRGSFTTSRVRRPVTCPSDRGRSSMMLPSQVESSEWGPPSLSLQTQRDWGRSLTSTKTQRMTTHTTSTLWHDSRSHAGCQLSQGVSLFKLFCVHQKSNLSYLVLGPRSSCLKYGLTAHRTAACAHPSSFPESPA